MRRLHFPGPRPAEHHGPRHRRRRVQRDLPGPGRSLTEQHRLEDRAVFPHLRKSQRGLQAVLDRLDEEHRTIHFLLSDVDRALVHLARNPGDHGPITAAIDVLTDTVLSHFAYEERELLGPLARFGFFRNRPK
ncbi:hemerythrin domain-containing protein [Streptomyces sp. NPDC000880]